VTVTQTLFIPKRLRPYFYVIFRSEFKAFLPFKITVDDIRVPSKSASSQENAAYPIKTQRLVMRR